VEREAAWEAAYEAGLAPAGPEPGEPVEAYVQRVRPRSIRRQFRFLRTLAFAFWMFGRLIFWQIYVARWFPRWVNSRNTQRWRKYAREFRAFAIDMGGVMIKAGQFGSTRADVLPEEVIAELASLQDEVPTVPFRQIAAVLRQELGETAARFRYIDKEPIAAASLGQVHSAQLITGEKVVVKVQRPGIREIVYTDMAALFIVAKVAMRFSFVRRRADAVGLVEEFGRVLLEEVSYVQEARHARRFRRMFVDDPGVHVPIVYTDHSTDVVLTLEDVTSLKITDHEALAAAGIDRRAVAQRLMDTYMQQIFEDRFFHADPHPGNVFVRPLPVTDAQRYVDQGGGRPFELIFIDFGMIGSLTPQIVQGLINTLTAVLSRDARRLVRSYQELDFLLPGADLKRLEEATKAVFDQVWGLSMSEMATMDFAVMADIGIEFNDLLFDMPFRLPQDFIYLARTVSILTGIATQLDPAFNPWSTIQTNMQRFILTDREVDLAGQLRQQFLGPLEEVLEGGPEAFAAALQQFFQQIVYRLQAPERIEKMLDNIMKGEVAVETKLSNQQRRLMERIELQGKRTSRTMLVGSLIIAGTLFYTNNDQNLALGAYGLAATLYVSGWFMRPG